MTIKTVLAVAHPGHELLLYNWMEREKPLVLIWTDGSGSRGAPSRLEASRRLIKAAGATPGPLFGLACDQDFYSAILAQDLEFFSRLLEAMTSALVDNLAEQIVSDPVEEYSPVHDLCSMISTLAAERAGRILKRKIRHLDFDIEFRGSRTRAQQPLEVIVLSPAQLECKASVVASAPELSFEVNRLLQLDPGLLDREALYERSNGLEALKAPSVTPQYEIAAAALVSSGVFETLITFKDHIGPLIGGLLEYQSRDVGA